MEEDKGQAAEAVTERKHADEELRKSEERFRLAAQAGKMFAYEWDVATDVIVRSPEAVQILRIDEGAPISGQQILAKVHTDDRERVMAAIAALSPDKPYLQISYRMIRTDGTVIWVERNSRAHFDAQGQMLRVVGMVADITERKRAEEALVELNHTLEAQSALLKSSEELLKIFVKNVPVAVAMLDRDMRYLQVSDRWCSDNSVEASELLGRSREEIPEMPQRWKEVNRRALQGETLRADEDRWESGGRTRWNRWEVLPWRNPDGTVGGILVFAEDITNRKQMEEELSGMSRKLIEAQEQERARIARELHDDIGQRLALLAVELQLVQDKLVNVPPNVLKRMRDLGRQTAEISTDVHNLSHELHSSKLELLGVSAAMKSWCKEFGSRQKMQIDFQSDDVPSLPKEISLCLFRVLQESVSNADRHSDVKRIEVQLYQELDEIYLIVRDSGKGFDVAAVERGKGLGLTSMRERVRLVNGTIAIESKPMAGTTIRVRVPFHSEKGFQRAGG